MTSAVLAPSCPQVRILCGPLFFLTCFPFYLGRVMFDVGSISVSILPFSAMDLRNMEKQADGRKL